MISINDHRKEDGSIDWEALRKSEIGAGERCMTCGTFIVLGSFKRYGPQECSACKGMRNSGESLHPTRLRCPRCREKWTVVGEIDGYAIYEDGDHDVLCPLCGHEFRITTSVSYTFRSPELEEGPDEED